MLRILSSLLLVMAIGGGLHTNSVRAEETSKLSNTARITAYWQAMIPNTPMPSAILNLLNRPDGTNDRVTKHDTANIPAAEKGTIEENSSAPFLKSRKMRSHAEESQIPGEDQKIDDQKFLFYGQSVKNKDKKVLHSYVPTEKSEDQKFLFYGKAKKTVKNNDQKFLFYGKADEKDDQKFLFYGKENDHETTKSNLKAGDHHATATKNDDQNFLFYGQREKNPSSAVKNDDQKFLFYGREERNHEPTTKNDDQKFLFYGHAEKNEGRITKPNVQGDSHEGEGGHIHGSTMITKNNEQKFLFYGQTEKNQGPIVKNDDQKFLFYGQAEKNHGPTAKNNEQNILLYGHVGKNEGDGNEGESGHIHGGTTTAKNGDQNFLFYGQTEKNHGSIVKNDDQKFLFYGQEEKNHGPTTKTDDQKFLFYGHAENDEEITKSNVQDDGHKGETGHTHGRTTTAKNSDENILFYGQTEKNHGSNVKNDDQKFLFYGQAEKNHGATLKNDDQKFLFYGATDKNDGEITKPNMQAGDDDAGTPIAKNDDQNFLFYGQTKKNHGSTMKKDDQKFLFYGQAKKNHGSTVKNDDQKFLFYGQADKNDGELTKSNVRGHGHGVEGGHMHAGTTTVKNDDQTFLFYGEKEKTHGSTMKNDDQKFLFYGQTENKHGLTTKNNDQNFLFYGHADKNHGHGHEGEGGDIHGGTTTAKNDDQKFLFYGETEKNHGLTAKNDDEKFLFYGHAKNNDGPPVKNDDQKFLFYGQTEKNDDMITKSNMKGDGHEGKGGHVHGGLMFVEDSLIAGSTITPYIQPSFTLGASLLPRHVADSIPVSTRNFTDIMTMFAPASYAMADAIWSTLDLCEHPPRVKGERDACVVSLESMVEFASSVLGTTHGLRALSSPDVPADGVMAGKRYKVKELRRVTEAGDSVTCHGLRFPVAMFICHAVNPTRLYSVTLEREHDGGAGVGGPERMEALVVCHLDTSDFNPMKMPEHVKPGDAPLCHFIARDNVLWAPSAAAAAAA